MDDRPTLAKARQAVEKKTAKVYRPSDFLTKQQIDDVKLAKEKGVKRHIHFDSVDAYSAEIVARFGYDAYRAWNAGEITNKKMAAWISAERTREKSRRLESSHILVSAIAGANNPGKNGQAPKSLKAATKNLKRLSNEIKEATK